MKLRVLNIADATQKARSRCIAFLILRLITFARKFPPISRAGMKLPPAEKESIEYTLSRDAASRPGYIKILLAMKGRA